MCAEVKIASFQSKKQYTRFIKAAFFLVPWAPVTEAQPNGSLGLPIGSGSSKCLLSPPRSG